MNLKFTHPILNCHPERSRRMLKWSAGLTVLLFSVFLIACNDDEVDSKPKVKTGAVTDITGTTATVSGEITSDGGNDIISSGFVYSSTNAVPELGTDAFTEETATDGEFSSDLIELSSSSEYHVRAYAVNKKGIGYGEVVDFSSGNAPPVATDVTIIGEIQADLEVTAEYTYTDSDGDLEGGTTFQWYRSDDATGAGTIAIADATSDTYRISLADEGKIIWVGVTPKAATGNTTGEEAESDHEGPVGEATTVTFIYNGEEVTYGIINSTVTGRRWLDRSLGAPNTPTSYYDFANFGDLFQWGRSGADGHQLMIRTSFIEATPVNPETTTTLSTTDTPGHSKFIIAADQPRDWRSPQNNNLWQAPEQINNPCPEGWHIPTETEWKAEGIESYSSEADFDKLNITAGGYRDRPTGAYTEFGAAYYWSSTVNDGGVQMIYFWWTDFTVLIDFDRRGNGAQCRCIKDQ